MTDLAKLRKLLEKATKGEWATELNSAGFFDIFPNIAAQEQWRGGVGTCHEAEHIDGITVEEMTANAKLIAALRNEAPALLDEVEKLRVALRECADAYDHIVVKTGYQGDFDTSAGRAHLARKEPK